MMARGGKEGRGQKGTHEAREVMEGKKGREERKRGNVAS
jgi:hypothetical protein